MLASSSHKELVNKAILTSNPPAQLQMKGIDQIAMLELQSEIKGIFKTHVILMMDTCDRLLDSCFLVQGKLKIGKKKLGQTWTSLHANDLFTVSMSHLRHSQLYCNF